MSEEKNKGPREEFKLEGSQVVEKIKELIHEGNIRNITLKNEEGKTLIEIPLTLGVVGAALPAGAGRCRRHRRPGRQDDHRGGEDRVGANKHSPFA